MNILAKQVLAGAAIAGVAVAVSAGAILSAAGNPEASPARYPDTVFALPVEKAQDGGCEASGDLLRHLVTLREAGWTQQRVEALNEDPSVRDLVDLVFRLNDDGLAKREYLAQTLTDLCLAQAKIIGF